MISLISLDNKGSVTDAINKLISGLSLNNKIMQNLADGNLYINKIELK